MSHTGRELTLFSIYGVPDAVAASARKPKRVPKSKATSMTVGTPARPSVATIKPTRPLAPPFSGTLSGRPSSRGSLAGRVVRATRTPTERDEEERNADSVRTVNRTEVVDSERVEEVSGRAQATNIHAAVGDSHARAPSPTVKIRSGQQSPKARGDTSKRIERPLPLPPPVVMSLYGDGFVELTSHSTPDSTLTVPFSLKIRMFKAADESMERNKVESDASRHVSPELNDEGEFVRWSCCGSTDRSVFGCPVASGEQHEKLSVQELLTLRPPKLVACKLSAKKTDPTDTLRFVIFDRGYPAGLTAANTGALNAGCRIWWRGYECWATRYDIPCGSWVNFSVAFDGQYLQIHVDDELVDTAVVHHSSRVPHASCRANCTLGCLCSGTQWSNQSTGSIYIGGYSKYSRSVDEWRVHAGFVGLIAEVRMFIGENVVSSAGLEHKATRCATATHVHLIAVGVHDLKDFSTPSTHDVAIHRNVFWRKEFPSFLDSSMQRSVRLLGNFYHGAHHDISSRGQHSFDNLLLSAVQVGDVRVRIELSRDFAPHFGSEHGCRTQSEFDSKCNEFIRQLETLSPLLVVDINPNGTQPPMGSFEISLELARSAGNSVSISLHSMIATSCFPSLRDVKARIGEIFSHEARRSPGEGAVQQAFRYFLSLAEQGRDSRERAFMESVMNRKAVITEKRIVAVFQRIGFHFSHAELLDLIRLFKTMQDEYHRHQHRMDDIPTMSLISPTSRGLYKLPLMHQVSINVITPSERSATRSNWDFVAILLNYDLQLIDFIESSCPDTAYGDASYAQSRYLHGGFVDRFSINISAVPSHVYCILLSLRKRCRDLQPEYHQSLSQVQDAKGSGHELYHDQDTQRIVVQLENKETLQQLAHFEVQPDETCKWLSLAALYRSRKSKLWKFQALGGSTQASSIHAGLEDMNSILVDRHIVQVYEVIVCYEGIADKPEFADFASRFSKNIRFGRNGNIHVVSHTSSSSSQRGAVANDPVVDTALSHSSKLEVALRIQGLSEEITVYRHNETSLSLPTVQSICRSILRVLADHGIKESLQQNPFVSGAKKSKRPVTIRVTTEDTNVPVSSAYIFIETSLDNQNVVSNLASKIVPTLTMGSRLVSIRRRLQKKKYSEEVQMAARSFTENVITLGMRYAIVSLRNSKLVPFVRSRALLRRAMRRRYECIRDKILSAMSESERSRIYSRNGPTRLQQLFRPQLRFTPSEKELVEEVVEMELEAFRQELGIANSDQTGGNPQDHIEAVWQSHVKESHSESTQGADQSKMSEGEGGKQDEEHSEAGESSEKAVSRPKRSYVTDSGGVVTCHLAPGSYSLYVFHNDYFERTSLAVVFPTVNASGLYGGSLSTSAPQEIVVTLETFKWSYGIQVVDFYHQHVPKQIEGVPISIIDKVTSEETILTTRSDGSVAWEVRKGIYAVRVRSEGTSIVYSGSKNVVVDGGRYHPPRTIFIPILLGKVHVELAVCQALQLPECTSTIADVRLISEIDDRAATPSSPEASTVETPSIAISHTISMNSTGQLQLRSGKYLLKVACDGFIPYSRPMDVPWNAKGVECYRELVVLCPAFSNPSTYRIIFSYVNGAGVLDAAVEIKEPQTPTRTCWQHGVQTTYEDATFHGASVIASCEYQTFTITCLPGRSYRLCVGITAQVQSHLRQLRPRVQVYNSSGLVVDVVLNRGTNWHGEFYWCPCSWNSDGLISTSGGISE